MVDHLPQLGSAYHDVYAPYMLHYEQVLMYFVRRLLLFQNCRWRQALGVFFASLVWFRCAYIRFDS